MLFEYPRKEKFNVGPHIVTPQCIMTTCPNIMTWRYYSVAQGQRHEVTPHLFPPHKCKSIWGISIRGKIIVAVSERISQPLKGAFNR